MAESHDLPNPPSKRKRSDVLRVASSMVPVAAYFHSSTQNSTHNIPVSSSGISPVANDGAPAPSNSGSERPPAAIANSIVETVVRDDADALHLLFDTALHPSTRHDHQHAITSESHTQSHNRRRRSDSTLQVFHDSTAQHESRKVSDNNVDVTAEDSLLGEPPVLKAEQLSLWSRFQPCVQRYLSPAEAITYLD